MTKCVRIGTKSPVEAYGKLEESRNEAFWTILVPVSHGDKMKEPLSHFVVVQRDKKSGKYGLNRSFYEAPQWIPDLWFDTPEEGALWCYMMEDGNS